MQGTLVTTRLFSAHNSLLEACWTNLDWTLTVWHSRLTEGALTASTADAATSAYQQHQKERQPHCIAAQLEGEEQKLCMSTFGKCMLPDAGPAQGTPRS
jgi:hypothetical protein